MEMQSVLSQEEANEYLGKLLSGKIEPDNDLEVEYVNQLRNISSNVIQSQSRLQNLQSEIEGLKNSIQRAIGQREALANVLVTMEKARKNNGGVEKKD